MKLTYDPQYNIAYIALRDKTEPIETLQVSDELHIDLAPDGTIYGIELLNANQQLAASRYITSNYSALRSGNTGSPINKLTSASRTGIPCFLKVDR
jgi:uncharacterized protein YuzE